MRELNTNNSSQLISRTPELIAAEINNIKQQTRNMVLYNSIEIGRRLVEAKALVQHGEWGEWLERSVDYSQRTANNLMRIFEEYGSEQITLLGSNVNSQAFANLSYSQAVALLGVPEEEREQFVEEHDTSNMSTRELQEAIKERDQARKEKQELEERLKKADTDFIEAYNELKKSKKEAIDVKSEKLKVEQEAENQRNKYLQQINDLKEKLKKNPDDAEKTRKLEKELKTAMDQVQKLTEEMNKPGEVAAAVVEKIPEEIEKELNELRTKLKQQPSSAGIRYKLYFDDLVKTFQELLTALEEIKAVDDQDYERYKNATAGLINRMVEKLA